MLTRIKLSLLNLDWMHKIISSWSCSCSTTAHFVFRLSQSFNILPFCASPYLTADDSVMEYKGILFGSGFTNQHHSWKYYLWALILTEKNDCSTYCKDTEVPDLNFLLFLSFHFKRNTYVHWGLAAAALTVFLWVVWTSKELRAGVSLSYHTSRQLQQIDEKQHITGQQKWLHFINHSAKRILRGEVTPITAATSRIGRYSAPHLITSALFPLCAQVWLYEGETELHWQEMAKELDKTMTFWQPAPLKWVLKQNPWILR